MSSETCPRTDALLAALHRGEPLADGADHAAGCAPCSAALAVEAALRGHAAALAPGYLADPEVLLFRARLRGRQRAAARALRPIVWAERLAAPVAALLALWLWPWLRDRGAGLLAAERWTAPLPAAGIAVLLVLVAVVAALLFVDVAGSEG